MKIQPFISRTILCVLAWCTFAIAIACAQTITHVPLFTFDSNSNSFISGDSVSGAGDANGDGFDDLIVGTPNDNLGTEIGFAQVFSGVDGSLLYINADFVGNQLGASVSCAGDVNGDGFDDQIVGAPGDDKLDDFGIVMTTDSGSARVLSGVNGQVLYNFEGESNFDFFGRSVSGAGDVNGDGFDDVIVGIRGDDNNGFDSGSVRVFSGANGNILYTFDGDSSGDEFGWSVSGAGDVNGDGLDDFIVGADGDDNNGSRSGSARVFSGADGSVLFSFDGDSANDAFGTSVSGAGDVNGDGFDDLIVGAPGDENNGSRNGSVQVFSGVDGSILYDLEGESPLEAFGSHVSDAGDVNGDGFDDLMVGSRVFSGADGSALYNFEGDSPLDSFGFSVSGAGDVNGDGLDDLIVGALRGGANSRGYARVFVSQITAIVLLGDANQDGEANFLDINPFIGLLASNMYLEQADCNEDGVLDFLDIASFIAILAAQ